jgi:hypothetical protein
MGGVWGERDRGVGLVRNQKVGVERRGGVREER